MNIIKKMVTIIIMQFVLKVSLNIYLFTSVIEAKHAQVFLSGPATDEMVFAHVGQKRFDAEHICTRIEMYLEILHLR
jgi:hypothetical protein